MNRKQAILEEISEAKLEGNRMRSNLVYVLNPEKLANYLLNLEERIEGKGTMYDLHKRIVKDIEEKYGLHGVFNLEKPQEKDDLDSRFEKVFNAEVSERLLNFIREEGERRYKEGALFANERNYLHAKQAGRKEALEEVEKAFIDAGLNYFSEREVVECLHKLKNL